MQAVEFTRRNTVLLHSVGDHSICRKSERMIITTTYEGPALESGTSLILCGNEATRELFSYLPNVLWEGNLGRSTERTLRKQITAWIDDRLSRT